MKLYYTIKEFFQKNRRIITEMEADYNALQGKYDSLKKEYDKLNKKLNKTQKELKNK